MENGAGHTTTILVTSGTRHGLAWVDILRCEFEYGQKPLFDFEEMEDQSHCDSPNSLSHHKVIVLSYFSLPAHFMPYHVYIRQISRHQQGVKCLINFPFTIPSCYLTSFPLCSNSHLLQTQMEPQPQVSILPGATMGHLNHTVNSNHTSLHHHPSPTHSPNGILNLTWLSNHTHHEPFGHNNCSSMPYNVTHPRKPGSTYHALIPCAFTNENGHLIRWIMLTVIIVLLLVFTG